MNITMMRFFMGRERVSNREWHTKVVSKTIPSEVYEYLKNAKTVEDLDSLNGKIKFYDKPYLRLLKPEIKRLDKIDDNNDSLNTVISVLMLREGFDRKNISVIVVLRATEADLLLEQIVGRGLRLMFTKTGYDSIWQSKVEAVEDIKRNKLPKSSFDFLFIVEHPRFEKFYQNLREEGYLIGIGDTSNAKTTGDVIPPKWLGKMIWGREKGSTDNVL
ncbi:MAG: hypothetical protein WBZ36_24355 [Candidatus Nitrosopolaris sp.]